VNRTRKDVERNRKGLVSGTMLALARGENLGHDKQCESRTSKYEAEMIYRV